MGRSGAESGNDIDLPCRFANLEIDWRKTLAAIAHARVRGVAPATIARGFHRALGRAVADGACVCADTASVDTIVLSGGVMQNQLLLEHIRDAPGRNGLQIWVNRAVPPNDGGVSLGQAALVAS